MKVINLNKKQVEKIYNTSMKNDFPDNERKPLARILAAIDQGVYECLGLIDGEEILGYAFFFKDGENYLFDYFATYASSRNQGYGSEFLKYIAEYFSKAAHVIGEVENPETAENAEDKELQTRRLNFYLRNGYEDTGARTILFGVNFIILRMCNGNIYTRNQVEKIYLKMYKDMLPEKMFEKNVKIVTSDDSNLI